MIKKGQFISHDVFIIFGAGTTGRKVNAVLDSIGKKALCFLVTDKTNVKEKFSGPPVVPLEKTALIENKNLPVIIAVFNREKNSTISSIISTLEQKGFTQIITYFEFHAMFANELGDHFWLTKPFYYRENQSKFTDCLSLFEEPKSRLLYHQMIDFLGSFDPHMLPEPDYDHQYFPEDLTVWDGSGAFVDAGSYDGQTIIDAAHRFGVLSKVIAFEPDLANVSKIDSMIDWTGVSEEAIIFPCGVWSDTRMVHFSAGNGEGSAISDCGNSVILAVSIDGVMKGVVPGYIKMDVEGAEMKALMGAKRTIATHRPSLAISIYHAPGHLFEIQLLLNNWELGYKFFLRSHGNNLFDTVLYCIQ